ncbi:hypothetical protein PHYPSEUDO_014711 [Phytophthora pseudosyringae]|uniref:Uncharacterized protein n=1 Tax=Phytophthora pseudosyringae TaxID=221518 RepID=A0A8T1W090_9STRA|nr:hypothetical protein PHYPSEUDO_014711 [Phytophthora pseudosyringae]
MFAYEKSFQQIWRELTKKGWTYRRSTGLSNDQRYLPPSGNLKGTEGEASLLRYCRNQGWLAFAMPPPVAAQTRVDATQTPVDAMLRPLDAAPTPLDAVSTPIDAASTPTDAVPTPIDAASTPAIVALNARRLLRERGLP